MGFSTVELIMVSIAGLYLLFFTYLVVKSKQYDELFENLDEDDYQFKDFFSIGYAFMETIKYGYKSKRDRDMRKNLAILKDEKYADYYVRLAYAQGATYALAILLVAFALYIYTGELIIMFISTLFIYAAVQSTIGKSQETMKSRHEEMMKDFAEVVSQLALLTNAGMVMHEAWEQVAYSKDSEIYKEMQESCNQMNNGVSETDAITLFGLRCALPEIKKFASTITQGISKGNANLVPMLLEQNDEVWEARKQAAKREGELANNKLTLPSMLVFVGVLVLVIVPIMANLGAV